MVRVLMEVQSPDVLPLYIGIWYRWSYSISNIATANCNGVLYTFPKLLFVYIEQW